MSSNQNIVLKASGISTHPNPLSATPSGSMLDALNVVIDRAEVVEPRRGFFQYGSSFGLSINTVKQLINYKDVILRHVLSKIQFDADIAGDFRDIVSSDGFVNETESGLRIKYIEANGNLYLCTNDSIKKISARNKTDLLTVPLENAGGAKALDINSMLNFSKPGFLEPNSKCAYRVVFGKKDLNENLILGSPSASNIAFNSTTASCFTTLSFSLPSDITNKHFYQIYRTGLSVSSSPTIEPGDPGDEMNLVFEENITSANILAGIITVADITPEDFRKTGTLLYTNPVSGEGIVQANEKPPFAKDIALYKNYTFYANTRTVQRLFLSILTIEGIVSNVDTFTVSDNAGITSIYTFRGTHETFTADYTGAVIGNLFNAAPGAARYFTIISANDERKYYVWYYAGVNDLDPILSIPALAGYVGIKVLINTTDTVTVARSKTGDAILANTDDFNVTVSTVSQQIIIECSNNGAVTTVLSENIANFTITANGLGTGEDILNKKILLPKLPVGSQNGPTVSQQLEQISKSLMKVINAKDTLVAGYYQSTYLSVPGQMLLEGRQTTGPIFYLYSTIGAKFTPTIPLNTSSVNQVFSTNEVRPNRLMFSKLQQPDAVPIVNFIDIGPKDRGIKRIIALRDSLFIFKEDGIYRLSGDFAPFTISPFDFSVQVLAADTAVVLNNQIYALSTQGVIVVTDTGVSVISRPIENLLLNIIREGFNYKTISFGVSYESDRAYHLWVPTLVGDTYATQCYRYNTFTNSWTRWDKNGTCGVVNFGDNKLYLGSGDLNVVEKERKSLTRDDYADREFGKDILFNQVLPGKIQLDNLNNVNIGDVLIQRQHMTCVQFNRLLKKLDDDTFIAANDYLSTLSLKAGETARNNLVNLANKLDLDSSLLLTNYSLLIGNYSNPIISIVPGLTTSIINISGINNFKVGRYVKFNNINTFPVLSKIYKITAVGASSITVAASLDTVFTPGVSPAVSTAVDTSEDVAGCYNLISNNLNIDPNANFTNYPIISDYVDFEINIDGLNMQTNQILVSENQLFLSGTATVYNAIQSRIIYNPQFFGDPSMDKQVREGTALFENSNFSTFKIGYASDKHPSFEDITFTRPGTGDFGQFINSQMNFGGIAAPIPLRTYIPMSKQRCRFLNVKLEHKVAFEKYSLFGISLTFRPYSTRTNT